MRRITANDPTGLDGQQVRDAYEFPANRPWLRVSMVATLDGVTHGADGDSRSIASPADRRIFSTLRLRADVVLVGAGTLRDIDYPPSRLPIAIVSNSLDLPATLRLFAESTPTSPRPIVYTTHASASANADLADRADVVTVGATDVDVNEVVCDLDARGLGRIHCEGGPRLVSGLAEADLVDEFLLTITPRLIGGNGDDHVALVGSGLDQRYRFADVLEEDGSVFVRAVRDRNAA